MIDKKKLQISKFSKEGNNVVKVEPNKGKGKSKRNSASKTMSSETSSLERSSS